MTQARSGFERVLRALDLAGSVWILLLVFLVTGDVVGRYFFDHPITGVPELMSLSIVGIVFLQLPHTLRVGRFVRSDALLDRLADRYPAVGRLLRAAHDAVGLAAIAVLAWFMFPRLRDAWVHDEAVGDYGLFTAPVWPIDLIIVIGAVLTGLQYAVQLASHLRGEPAEAGREGTA